MSSLLDPSPTSAEETRYERVAYTGIAVVVAAAMFVAASGSGSGDYVTAEPPSDLLNIAGNVFAAVTGVLVLIPRTRAAGAVLAVVNMFIAMVLNYRYDGVDYFVDFVAYNTVTAMLASILIGHYARDLTGLLGRRRGVDGGDTGSSPESSSEHEPEHEPADLRS